MSRWPTWNHAIAVLGVPGTGKSTYALRRVVELAARPAYAVAHDAAWRVPHKWPDGTRTPIVRHGSEDAARAAFARLPGGVHVVPSVDVYPALDLAKDLAARGSAPSVLLVDEIVTATGATPHHLDDRVRQLLALRRHWGVALVWTGQNARIANNQLLSMSTEIVCFRLTDARDLRRLSEAGVSDEVCRTVRTLPNFSFVRVTLG